MTSHGSPPGRARMAIFATSRPWPPEIPVIRSLRTNIGNYGKWWLEAKNRPKQPGSGVWPGTRLWHHAPPRSGPRSHASRLRLDPIARSLFSMSEPSDHIADHFEGSLLGAMIGDSLGSAVENASNGLVAHRYPQAEDLLALRPGPYGSTTEMTVALA